MDSEHFTPYHKLNYFCISGWALSPYQACNETIKKLNFFGGGGGVILCQKGEGMGLLFQKRLDLSYFKSV